MIDNEPIIFPLAEEQQITEDQFNHSQTAYEQQKKLLKTLADWTANAAAELETYMSLGKGDIFEKKIPGYDEKTGNNYLTIYYCPGPVSKEATPPEKAACNVLKAANALYQSLLAEDNMSIANLGIELGIAAAIAHASPFEELALSGKKSKEGYRRREVQVRKENCQDWLRENQDKVSHITKKAQLKEIPVLEGYLKYISFETLVEWVKEIYPNQFKGGRPKKPTAIP